MNFENLPAPPPYSEDKNAVEPSFRATEIDKPSEILTYHFELSPMTDTLSVPFPTLWLTRDVDIKDWTNFLACLPEQYRNVTEEGHFERYVDEIAWRRKVGSVIGEWNKNFFEPRGLHVVPDLSVGAQEHQGKKTH